MHNVVQKKLVMSIYKQLLVADEMKLTPNHVVICGFVSLVPALLELCLPVTGHH